MAVERANQAPVQFPAAKSDRRTADAFLNLQLHTASDDGKVRIDQGIALYANTRLGRSLINAKAAFDADPKNKDKEFTVTLSGNVNIVDPNKGDYEF